MVVSVEDECSEGDENQWEEVSFGSHHWLVKICAYYITLLACLLVRVLHKNQDMDMDLISLEPSKRQCCHVNTG